jgi:hypothetical protein
VPRRVVGSSDQVRSMIVLALLALAAAPALAATTHRSIMDFVDAQGHVSFGPPGTQRATAGP